MQCPICSQELADQTECPNCTEKDSLTTAPTDDPKSEPTIESTNDSDILPAQNPPPQAADSPALQTEPESPVVNKSASEEPVPPTSNIEPTALGNSINSKGDQSIINRTIDTFYQTELRDNEIHSGRDTNFTGTQVIVNPAAQPQKAEEEKSLYSLTQNLPQRTIELHESVRAEVNHKAIQLKTTRLMFVTCPYAEFALDAGHVAIRGLGLDNPEHNRMLYFEDTGDLKFTATKLLEQLPEEKDERSILIYAQNIFSQSFLDSFFDVPDRINIIREGLQSSHLFMVVIVAPQHAQKRLSPLIKRNPPFAYAEIPFLRPFLQQNYPGQCEHLEAEITDQRARGKWQKDETSFCQQILDHYKNEQLEAVVGSGGPADPELSAESMLKGIGPIEKTVLYTAAFFQEITPLEFCRVVEALLTGRTMSVTSPTNGEHNSDTLALRQTEIPLCRLWGEEKDIIFTKWLRETDIAKDFVRVVSLSNSALREPLRRLFEKQHRFYVIDQFKALQERGIFFDPSIRLAENTTQIAVEMAGFYPDEFNENWVVGLITRLRQHFASDHSDAPDGGDTMFQFLRNTQPGAAFNLALERVSDVFRRMLESPQLKGIVQSCLEHLIKNGYHEVTLLLTRQLQFTPEFDTLYWFKQLLHRADKITRNLTYYYLYAYLKRMGSGVYEGLKKIESWLPPAERDPSSYSQFDYFVLRLLIQYGVETVARFNSKYYGNWPSRYPLLAIKDSQIAVERTSLLARWLLHPGIEATLVGLRMGNTQMTLIGALLAEWTFILLGQRDPSPVEMSGAPRGSGAPQAGGTADDPHNEFSAAMLYDLLIQQFASRTDLTQRLELLTYWNRLNHDLLKFLGALPYANELRKELSWKRNLVGQLIAQFKRAAPAGKKSPRTSQLSVSRDHALLKQSGGR
jgi:hypothetical protein